MSAPLQLNSNQLRELSYALHALSKVRNETGIQIGGHSGAEVTVGGAVIGIAWSGDEYIVDDWIGI